MDAQNSRVRDRFWMWGHVAGSFDGMYNLPGTSRMSPAEAAFDLNVPNMIMVRFFSATEEYANVGVLPQQPYKQHLISFRPLKRVVWSIGGFGTDRRVQRGGVGMVTARDLKAVWNMAGDASNLVGAQLDVFFRDSFAGRRMSTFSRDELDYIKGQLKLASPKLDLWVTFYRHDLDHNPAPFLDRVDVVTFWTRQVKDLETLEDGFVRLEQVSPGKRKLLGCSMWDFEDAKPIPLALMQKQCRLGLEWLRKGRIEGMIFRASPLCDLQIEAVEWTRNWIRDVGDKRI